MSRRPKTLSSIAAGTVVVAAILLVRVFFAPTSRATNTTSPDKSPVQAPSGLHSAPRLLGGNGRPPSREDGISADFSSAIAALPLRRQALQSAYGQMPIDELLDMTLRTRDPSRKEMRLSLLIRKEESLPVILARLRQVNDSDVYNCILLIQTQLRWQETIPALLDILRDAARPEKTRGRAATACALFQVPEALTPIRDLLDSSNDAQARQWCAMALGMLGDHESTQRLKQMLQNPSPYVQAAGALALGYLGSTSGEQTSLALSYSDTFDIRLRAAEALREIGTEPALARLTQLSETDSSPTVRSESKELRDAMALDGLQDNEAVARLVALLGPENSEPPRWAFSSLADTFGYSSVSHLLLLATNATPLQQAASTALLQLASGATPVPRKPNRRI